MAKQTGLGDQLIIGGTAIGGDTQSIGSLSTPIATLDQTGINKYAMERNYGLRDGQGEFTTFFNDAADGEHPRLKLLPRTDVDLMYLRGSTLGNAGIGMRAKQIGYDPTRGDDGSLTFNVSAQANSFGLDWGRQLTPGLRSDTTGTTGTSVDLGTGTVSFGWQAYLQVISFTGTSVTVTVGHSSDDGVADPYTALVSFNAATAPGAQRMQSATATTAVERYVRVNTSGTFSQATFAVVFTRNRAMRFV